MAWTNPTIRTVGTLIAASDWNSHLVNNISYISSTIEPSTLINQSGSALGVGAITIVATANDSSFTTTNVVSSPSVIGILAESVANGASGRIATIGLVTACVSGDVARGNFLCSASVAGRAKDSGATKDIGDFAIATGSFEGSAGSVTALLLPSMAGGAVPSTGVMWTTNGAVPAGYAEYTAASGRVIVGLVAGGTNQGTVGTALTNLQDVTHSHPITTVAQHSHGVPVTTTGMGVSGTTRTVRGDATSAGTITTATSGGSASTPAVSTGAPYVQLMAIEKS